MSHVAVKSLSPSLGRASPRWSVASHASPPLPGDAGLPASRAGLTTGRAWVRVEPPLF